MAGIGLSNTSPSRCTTSTEHKAHWLPNFCISPPNQLSQCIYPVLEQVCLVGCSKSSPWQSFSSLGWTASDLLRDIKFWIWKPWSQKAYGRANSRPNATVMWNLIWTWRERLPPSTRICNLWVSTLQFSSEQAPSLQAIFGQHSQVSHQFLIKISHRTSNLVWLQCSWLLETDLMNIKSRSKLLQQRVFRKARVMPQFELGLSC